jgi:hypothetical protein
MTAGTPGGSLTRALAAERYDVVVLRLLYGLLLTLEESAPAAREALLDELTRGGGRP